MELSQIINKQEIKNIEIKTFKVDKIIIDQVNNTVGITWSAYDSNGNRSIGGVYQVTADIFINNFLSSFGLTKEILENFVFNEVIK